MGAPNVMPAWFSANSRMDGGKLLRQEKIQNRKVWIPYVEYCKYFLKSPFLPGITQYYLWGNCCLIPAITASQVPHCNIQQGNRECCNGLQKAHLLPEASQQKKLSIELQHMQPSQFWVTGCCSPFCLVLVGTRARNHMPILIRLPCALVLSIPLTPHIFFLFLSKLKKYFIGC